MEKRSGLYPDSFQHECLTAGGFLLWIIISIIIFGVLKYFFSWVQKLYVAIPFFLISILLFFYVTSKGDKKIIDEIKKLKEKEIKERRIN